MIKTKKIKFALILSVIFLTYFHTPVLADDENIPTEKQEKQEKYFFQKWFQTKHYWFVAYSHNTGHGNAVVETSFNYFSIKKLQKEIEKFQKEIERNQEVSQEVSGVIIINFQEVSESFYTNYKK